MAKRFTFLFAALVLAFSTAFVPLKPANIVQSLAPSGQSLVRVLHAVPGAPAVDVWVDSQLVIENLAFGEITNYLALTAGNHDIEVVETGTTSPALIDAPGVVFASGQDYTIAARLDGTDLVPEIYVDDNTLPADGKAHVRFIHLSPDAPAVDVAVTGGPDLFTNIAYPTSSSYLEVDPGVYDLEVLTAGTSDVALALPDVSLRSDTVYTVFAVGEATETPATLEAVLAADAGYAYISVVHAVPDAPAVDVWLNGSLAIQNVEYQEVTTYERVSSGAYNVVVVPTGATTPEVINTDVVLNPMQDYTIAATGQLGDNTVEPVVYLDDNSKPAAGEARVRFIHLSPDAPAVDIAVAGGDVVFADTAFREASDYVSLPAGSYDLEVRLAGDSTVVLPIGEVTLQAGFVYTAYAFGEVSSIPPTLTARLVTQSRMSHLRVLHASPDAPNVDVWLDGEKVLENVPFATLSEYLHLPAGMWEVEITATGDTSPVISEIVTLEPDMHYTAAATGLVDDETLALTLFMDDFSMPMSGQALVRFIHLAPDAPAVDVLVAGTTTPLFSDIQYLEASEYIGVNEGTYDLEAQIFGTDTVVLTIDDVSVRRGHVYTVFAIGLAEGEPALQVVLGTDYEPFLIHFPIILQNSTLP